ncbi:hypothetical protein ACFLXU_00275 [Chloroflexota bacterium]
MANSGKDYLHREKMLKYGKFRNKTVRVFSLTFIDFLWIAGWFLVGLLIFQVRGIEHFFDTIGILVSVLSLFLLLKTHDPIAAIASSIGLDLPP